MPTNLYTNQGQLVTTIELPPFPTQPPAILWGDRFFLWQAGPSQYREDFLYAVPPETGTNTDPGDGSA